MRHVVVAGSGAAGLTAALAAAEAGARVTLCEADAVLGGTTALSGCVAWFPANHLMAAEGVDDSIDDALAYLRALALGDVDWRVVDAFARGSRDAAQWIERVSPVRWQSVPYPDYHAEFPGGKLGHRSLEPSPLAVDAALAARIRSAPNVAAPITYRELVTALPSRDEQARRVREGIITMGRAFIAGMVMALEARGVDIRVNARVTERPPGSALVLATGGFERDAALVRSFLRGPMVAPVGAPGARGDGLRLAQRLGARLANMAEAWWGPASTLPGETIDGEPFHRLVLTERARPNCLIVDSRGRRYMNEAQNYNDVGRAMHGFDATEFAFPAATSWLIFDRSYRSRFHLFSLRRDDPDPDWLVRADSIDELADRLGIEPKALDTSVARFNQAARDGVDADCGRGSRPYDRFIGEGLAPVDTPPFYALAVRPGCLGTKGGPATDEYGRVLDHDDRPIAGVYAAGNAAASAFGLAYPGAGGTIGPMIVLGRAAGFAAATE